MIEIIETYAPKFEKVEKYKDIELAAPIRKTSKSACYDMVAAEDIVIEPIGTMTNVLFQTLMEQRKSELEVAEKFAKEGDATAAQVAYTSAITVTLDEMKALTKLTGCKPTLIPTGYKAINMKDHETLELFIRSSAPLNYWIILANAVGVVDADYADNVDNEGHIFFQVINLSPLRIQIKRGDIIGQAMFQTYRETVDDNTQEKADRLGGFGSTNK